jgi:hypothetical protein
MALAGNGKKKAAGEVLLRTVYARQQVGRYCRTSAGLTRGSGLLYTEKEHVYPDIDSACDRVLFPHHCGFAAEWKSRRPGRRFWRHGFADGFRTAGFGNSAFQGNDGFRDHFYGYLSFAFDPGYEKRRAGNDGSGGRNEPGASQDRTGGAIENQRADTWSSSSAGP